jgi:hypothetical protein
MKVRNFFIGLILLIIGSVLFLRNITVTSNTGGGMLGGLLTNLFGQNTADPKQLTGILLVLIFVTLLILFIKTNIVTISAFILSILILVFSVISSMQIQMADMTGLEVAVIVGMMIIGLGMCIGNAISTVDPKGELK